jgi:cytochrome c-type biogenesis protein CcmH
MTKKLIQGLITILGLAMILTLVSVPVLAQEPTPTDNEVNAIAKQLYCPVCENTPLDVCPTQACHEWRELIRQMLAEGKSEAEIKQYFVDYYGARVLSEPPREGLNWLVYIVPPVVILAGAYLLYRGLRSWVKPAGAEAGSGSESKAQTPVEDEYMSRLEDELRKRE